MRDGVGPGCVVLPAGPWRLVLDFLSERFTNVTRAEIEARMVRGDIVDALGRQISPAQRYSPHLTLYYYRAISDEARIPFEEEVLFQDDYLVAVDKPHFLPVTPSGHYLQETLLVRLIRKLGIDTLAPMHRLDRETAGVMLFTVQPTLRGHYQTLFTRRTITKHYEAIASYRSDLTFPLTRRSRLVRGEPFIRMRETNPDEAGSANAETRIELLARLPGDNLAHYRLTPETGKKHQLRVHMAALGLPIRYDTLYPVAYSDAEMTETAYRKPLQLLARQIAFADPITGQARQFTSRRQLQVT